MYLHFFQCIIENENVISTIGRQRLTWFTLNNAASMATIIAMLTGVLTLFWGYYIWHNPKPYPHSVPHPAANNESSSETIPHIEVVVENTYPEYKIVKNSNVILTFLGVGASPPHESRAMLRKRKAIIAAELDAARQYAQWLKGGVIAWKTKSKDLEFKEDTLRAQGNTKSGKGLKTVNIKYNAKDGTAEVIRQVSLSY